MDISILYNLDLYHILPYVVAAFLVAAVTAKLLQTIAGQQKSPPGPWGFPIVGSLLKLDPKQPYQSLRTMVREYGPVYQLYMGGVRTVVLAREDIIRSTFALEAASGRAPLYLTFGIMDGKGLICSEGELWREHRRFTMTVMRALGMRSGTAKAALESKVLDAAIDTMKYLGHPDKASIVDPTQALLHSLGNSMNLLVFGIEYSRDDPVWLRLQELLHEGTKLIGVASAVNFLPWLRFLPHYRRIIDFIKVNQVKSHAVYQDLIEQFQAAQAEQHTSDQAQQVNHPPKHFVHAYLKEIEYRGPGMEGTFTYSQLHHVAADLFGAGTETSLTSLRWILLDLAQNQDVQELVYKEVSTVAGEQNLVTLSDLPQLVFTQAAMMESLRLHPVVPLGVPHGATKDLVIEGYHIPAGTMLIPLIAEVHHDTSHWTAPDEYRPHRFIDPSTNQIRRHSSFMPFQTGRRACPGEDHARMVMLLYLTQILLHYKMILPGDYAKYFPNEDTTIKQSNQYSNDEKIFDAANSTTNSDKNNSNINQQDNSEIKQKCDNIQIRSNDPRNEYLSSIDSNIHEKTTVDHSNTKWIIKSTDAKFLQEVKEWSDHDPFAEPICGFTTVPRSYKLVMIPRGQL
uniref:Cytochrome P450 306a1-like n=3 Tax=Hirondellea gigas TaxID=1518452 RepID=A0A6A7G0Z9_9CRUS